jgi:hypothetical protein
MEFANLPRLLNEHLSPPDPIEIEYTIRYVGILNWVVICVDCGGSSCSGEAAEYREAYDIEVEVDDNQATKPNLIAAKETGALDEQIAVLVGEIRQHYKRREFMQQFGASPVRTLHSLIAAQVRDYQRLPTDATGGTSVFEEDRYADFYYQVMSESMEIHNTDHRCSATDAKSNWPARLTEELSGCIIRAKQRHDNGQSPHNFTCSLSSACHPAL